MTKKVLSTDFIIIRFSSDTVNEIKASSNIIYFHFSNERKRNVPFHHKQQQNLKKELVYEKNEYLNTHNLKSTKEIRKLYQILCKYTLGSMS